MRHDNTKWNAVLTASLAVSILLAGCTGGLRKPPETSTITEKQVEDTNTNTSDLDLRRNGPTGDGYVE